MFIFVSITLVLTAFLTLLYPHFVKRKRIHKSMEQFPGPTPHPILGNIFDMGNTPTEHFESFYKYWKKYGNTYRLFTGPFAAAVILTDPKDIEVVLSSNKLLTKGWGYHFMWPWLGKGLFTDTGESWHRNRKIITPTFHFKILEQFLPAFSAPLDVLVNKLTKETKIGEAFDVFPYITLYGLDVICETAMGQHVNAQSNADGDYVQAAKDMCTIINDRTMNVLLMPEMLYKFSRTYQKQNKVLEVLNGFVNKVIKTRRKYLIENADNKPKEINENDDIGIKQRVAFLDLLLKSADEQGNPLPEKMIRDEVNTFMFAGHDTSSITLSFACYLLSLHPDIQEKAFQEQRDILGDDLTNLASHSDLPKMKYLDMIIKEVLRLYPPGPFFGRSVTEDTDLRGKTIVKDSSVIVAAYLAHRNPEHFPDPEKFDPDRFLPEVHAKRHPFAYIPFSAGPRNCIGQKFAQMALKASLSKLIRHFEFLPSGSSEKLVIAVEFTIKAMNGIPLKIKQRDYII